jgi:hypothetical protein
MAWNKYLESGRAALKHNSYVCVDIDVSFEGSVSDKPMSAGTKA